jgi:hypothetical protein
VFAFNAAGNSPSATASINAGLPAPTGLTATAVSSTRIDLAWVNHAAPTATGNRIFRNGTLLTNVAATATSYADTSVTEGTSYSYYVIATSPAGNSGTSNVATAVTPLIAPTLTLVTAGTDFVEFTWVNNSAVATSMEVWRRVGTTGAFTLRATVPVANLPWLDDPVDDGTTFQYYLVAINGVGRSANSNTVTATTVLFDPTNLVRVSATTTSITMRWTDDPGTTATGFRIERAPGNTNNFVQIATVANTGTASWTFTNTRLTKNTTYGYRVRAYKTAPAQTSAYTNTLRTTTPKK